MSSAALYDVDIAHVRAEPVRHDVRHRSYLWFVDLDDLPRRTARCARFEARDHLGDPDRSLRENVDAYLAEQRHRPARRADHDAHQRAQPRLRLQPAVAVLVPRPGRRRWSASSPRCTTPTAQRHRYLLRPDDAGRAETEKQFYVSPFYPVDGYYRMSVPEPGEQLAVTITLHRPDERPFTASVRGVRRPATRRAVLGAALRHPFETWRVRALITVHGIAPVAQGLAGPAPPAAPVRPEQETTMSNRRRTGSPPWSATTAGIELPVRLRAWDGSEAGPTAARCS